ncbi:probable tRNA N6-adenosine threonylcarbamoyltransferase, mitochondrial [Ceratina calcarata]|uniref:N(6)-L-threonylcarbamoyladenine synthase n=1 Tax=Ceratina calcarata TaxID=156304 RepID=A0AAJ7JIP0_9HYME|nr:probable tRNA N6-adenosine threonylcarbamoyltransferase, mitochondrial [Ceratina calcarata]
MLYKYLYKRFLNNGTHFYARRTNSISVRNSVHSRPAVILGIESSCDDTGCGIVNSDGIVIGEALTSQQLTHLNFGGIIPTFARLLHTSNVTKTCEDALRAANMKLRDVDAIATTVKPGLPMSLKIGTEFGKYLSKIAGKPFIPIHHMEAHALTVRMKEKVEFPYLVLLVSGGHCLLGIVKNVDKFYLLGSSINNSPGELFDKVARRMKLRNIPELSKLNGGLAVETAASKATNIDQFLFPPVMTKYRDCNFSFAGVMSRCNLYVELEEKQHDIIADMVIPNVYNLCAAVQLGVTIHICQRTQRAIEFIKKLSLIPEDRRTLVVSGGVACNNFLAKALDILCTELGYNFVRTPPKLCTDNGVMIAWNGVEKWMANVDVIRDPNEIEKIQVEKRCPFGESWIERVQEANLKCEWVNIKKKLAI